MSANYELTLKSGTIIKASVKLGDKPANWQPSGNHYAINVSVNGKSFRFDFWDSYHNMVEGEPCDVRGALCSWAMDVWTGINSDSADDIASEFGYTKPSEALRVFKGVKQAEKQYNRLGLSEDDLQELSDY